MEKRGRGEKKQAVSQKTQDADNSTTKIRISDGCTIDMPVVKTSTIRHMNKVAGVHYSANRFQGVNGRRLNGERSDRDWNDVGMLS